MALFRVFRGFLEGFGVVVWVCVGLFGLRALRGLWSSSLKLDVSSRAYRMSFNNSDYVGMGNLGRYNGFSIRPVLNL